MTLPAGLQTVTVTGTYVDAAGNPASGTVTITPDFEVVDTTDSTVIVSAPVTATLDASGHFSVTVVASDAANVSPQNFTHRVVVSTTHHDYAPFSVLLPKARPAVDISELVAVPPSSGVVRSPQNVLSVNAKTGAVVLSAADVSADPAGSAAAQAAAAQAAAGVYTDQQAAAAQTSAQAYTDTKAAAAQTAAEAYTDTKTAAAQTNAQAYTDTQVLANIGGRELAFAQNPTSTNMASTTTDQNVPGLQIAPTVASRPVTLHAVVCYALSVGTAASPSVVRIMLKLVEVNQDLSTTQLLAQSQSTKVATGESYNLILPITARLAPTAGQHTYKVTIATNVSGSSFAVYGTDVGGTSFLECVER